jgi:hypothetical protein
MAHEDGVIRMPTKPTDGEQRRIVPGLVIGPDDSRLLEELARFAERATPAGARTALIFMGHVLREAAARNEQSA